MLRLSGVFRVFRWMNRHRLIILTYHSVLPSTDGITPAEARNVVNAEMFAWQMAYLAKHCRCLTLEEAVERLRRDRALPPYSVVVTFDDGFRNNLRYAVPILRRYRIPATIFLTTGHIGRGTRLLWTERVGRLLGAISLPQTVTLSGPSQRLKLPVRTEAEREQVRALVMTRLKRMPLRERNDAIRELVEGLHDASGKHGEAVEPDAERYTFMSWSEAREVVESGMAIGSHTVEHPIMTSLNDDRRRMEVVESKQEIERQLGARCTVFSYPNGTVDDFDDRDKANLRKAGYVAAVTQIPGVNDRKADPFALRRLNIGRGHGPNLFVAQVSGFLPWLRSIAAWWTETGEGAGRVLAEASGPRSKGADGEWDSHRAA